MKYLISGVDEKVEGALARMLGYRLLGWAIISLWATAILVFLRVFRELPQAVDSWLLWISPLMIIRGIAGVLVHNELNRGVYISPPLKMMQRMSFLFGVSDGLLLLTALIILGESGVAGVSALALLAVAALSLMALVYMFIPLVMAVAAIVAVVPALLIMVYLELKLPLGVIVSGLAVLAGTCFGVLRFRSLFLRQLRESVSYENRIDEASESNYIFNQHWQNTAIAAIDWDRELRIRSWNPAAEKIFGYSAREAIGSSLDLIFSPDEARNIEEKWLKGEHADDTGVEMRVMHDKKRKAVYTEWYDTPLFLEGEFIGVACFVVNVTDRVKTWQELPARQYSAG